MKIKKAVIPAAGLGTRVLPISKAIPKEMIPLVDKPAIQYIVEEAVNSGIEDILIITNRGKGTIADHFDHNIELEQHLLNTNKIDLYNETVKPSNFANVHFIRQKETKGLGHAILSARSFIGNEPFAVLYGDDVIVGEVPATLQLIKAYNEFNKGVCSVKEVSTEAILKYSSLDVKHIRDNLYNVSDMIEKPTIDKILSHFAILGRCVLPPEIFDILENTKPGANNELQLTDAMKTLSNSEGMIAVDFIGKRYDIGNKLGILQANCEIAVNHPEIGDDFKDYIKEFAKTL